MTIAELNTRPTDRDEFLHDVFVTALEGGIGYWSAALTYHWSTGDGTTSDYQGFEARIVDEEDTEHTINRDVIRKGLRLIREGTPAGLHLNEDYIRRIKAAERAHDAGDLDAFDADIIVQVGLFEEVVYG